MSAVLAGVSAVGGMAATGTVAADVGTGRVAHYPMNSLSGRDGDTVRDASPERNDGTNHGATVDRGEGPVGNAFAFDGDDYVDLGTQLTQGFTAMTVATWLKDTRPNGLDQSVVERDAWHLPGGFGLFVMAKPGVWPGKVGWGRWVPHRPVVTSTVSVRDGEWHHVAGTLEPDGGGYRYKIYIDGVLDNANTDPGAVTSSTEPTGIARRIATANDYYFEGSLDEVRIYDRALSSDEVAELFAMSS